MRRQFVLILAFISCISMLFPQTTDSAFINPIGVGKKAAAGFVTGVKKSAFLPIIGAKKAFLLAPITIPLAIGAKAALAAKLAIPMGIGAAIGAPVGALVGAKVGAIKGAIIGKALIAAKLAAAKTIAVGTAALVAKPVILVAGAKAKLFGAGVGLIGKGVGAAGKAVAGIGGKITSFGDHFKTLTSGLAEKLTPEFPSLPSFPSLPTLQFVEKKEKQPSVFEYSITANGPHTGYKYKKATFYSDRKRRNANPEPEPEPQQGAGNAQHLLQLVQSQNVQHCLQRVICELSANPNSLGNDGIRFGRSLLLLESQADPTSAQQYRQAANAGVQFRSSEACVNFFPTCDFQSHEIVRIGNQLIEG